MNNPKVLNNLMIPTLGSINICVCPPYIGRKMTKYCLSLSRNEPLYVKHLTSLSRNESVFVKHLPSLS